jgi:hypothetical protein
MRKEVDTVGCRGDIYLARLRNGRAVYLSAVCFWGSFCAPTDGLQSSFRLPRRVTDYREQSDVAKSLLRRGACLFESAEAIGEPRNINNNVVCYLRPRI